MKLQAILIGILLYGVSTLWVKGRWALSLLEALVFLCAAGVWLRAALSKRPIAGGLLPLLPACVCLWGALQLGAHWTVVKSDTVEALLYWLAAACLVWLGSQACAIHYERQLFLKNLLIAGFSICLIGVIQLYTSEGRVFWLFASGYDSLVVGPFVSPNNYAAFVELLLPISLAMAFRDKRNSRAYLIIGAALVASVFASGSRAGSVIVIAESAVACVLQRCTDIRVRRQRFPFVIAAVLFTAVVGYQFLWHRLTSDQDPFRIRQEFLESSIRMIQAQPVHGFGLGTWPSAYKPFAIIDTGLVANHAHNEWVQWAAEGGLPAFALMLTLFVYCLPGALRSIWGLGVAAVFVHALLDYPFLRLGLAAWIFALIGAIASQGWERRSARDESRWRGLPGWPVRAVTACTIPLLAFGMYQSLRIGWADTLYRRGTPQSVARAAALFPDQAEYQMGLAQIDPARAEQHLTRAISLNPFLTAARVALASKMEMAGNLNGAESALLEAARRDQQYAPAWALANFYFRANQPDQFWHWARAAAQISYDGLGSLFDLCFAMTDNAQIVLDRVVVRRRSVERDYLSYLIRHRRLEDARAAVLRVERNANEDDRDALLEYVDRALDAGQFRQALETWNELDARHLVPYQPAKPGALVNGDFRQPILNRAFDWRTPATGCAVVARTLDEGPALEAVFSGKQPETCEVLNHFVALTIGAHYRLRFQYRTRDLPEHTGLYWTLGIGPGDELPASEEWSTREWHFQTPAEAARLTLAYRRALGTSRIEGTIILRDVRLEDQDL